MLMEDAAFFFTNVAFHQLILACELVLKIALLPLRVLKLCQLLCS